MVMRHPYWRHQGISMAFAAPGAMIHLALFLDVPLLYVR